MVATYLPMARRPMTASTTSSSTAAYDGATDSPSWP
jgi:hypothetical protein